MQPQRNKTAAAIVNLQGVRLSFPVLFEPGAYEPGDEPAFSARFIIDEHTPKGQRKALRSVMDDLCHQTWGKDSRTFTAKNPEERIPLRDGATIVDQTTQKPIDGYGEGTWFVAARSKKDKPPFIGKIHNGEAVEVTAEEGLIYGGCRVHAKLRLYTYDHPKHGRRVCAQLKAVIFAKHDEPFGDRHMTADDLKDMTEFESEDAGAPKRTNRRKAAEDEDEG